MGCVQCKCCRRYPSSSSDGDSRTPVEDNGVVKRKKLLGSISVPSPNFDMVYSVLSQRGYYPDSPDKENQDTYIIKTELQGNPNVHFFGVFDGHGEFGAQCSNFVKERVVKILSEDPTLIENPEKAYRSAFLRVNKDLHDSEIDDSMSGTTAITVLVVGDKIYVANVGDSRAVLAVKDKNRIVAEDLSCDQTPFRKDECERVKACGARVLTMDQIEGLKDPNIQTWGSEETEGEDPPRLWVQNEMYPGAAFTRSIGDFTAESIGVTAEPEMSMVHLSHNHLFFVVASDGIFEFLPSQAVVDLVKIVDKKPIQRSYECVIEPCDLKKGVYLQVGRYNDPRDGCAAAVAESYKLWMKSENRTDDITIIIVQIRKTV